MVVSFDKYEVRDLSVVSIVFHLKGDIFFKDCDPTMLENTEHLINERSPPEPAVTEMLFS